MELSSAEKEVVLAWSFIGATFFTMRSCDYLRTNRDEMGKRTKIIRLKNIILKREGITLEHDSINLLEAETVAITFEFQKNDKRNKTVNMFKTGDHIQHMPLQSGD